MRGEKRDKEEEKHITRRTGEKLREGGEERQRKKEDTKGEEGRLGSGRGAKKDSRMWVRESSDKDQNDGLWNEWWLVLLRFKVNVICIVH